jgi:hypothetical protein
MSDTATNNHITAPVVRVETSDISGGVSGDVVVRSWVADAIDADWLDLTRIAFLLGCGLVAGIVFPFALSNVLGDLIRWVWP